MSQEPSETPASETPASETPARLYVCRLCKQMLPATDFYASYLNNRIYKCSACTRKARTAASGVPGANKMARERRKMCMAMRTRFTAAIKVILDLIAADESDEISREGGTDRREMRVFEMRRAEDAVAGIVREMQEKRVRIPPVRVPSSPLLRSCQ